ncbi:hypothetical protein MKY24_23365 [Paenibacillus sp. FSL P2-0322]
MPAAIRADATASFQPGSSNRVSNGFSAEYPADIQSRFQPGFQKFVR